MPEMGEQAAAAYLVREADFVAGFSGAGAGGRT